MATALRFDAPATPRPSEPARPAAARHAGTAALGLAALLVAEAVRTIVTMRHQVNEDQTVLWDAARAWGRLQPHQPTFWGQTYGSTFEAVPIEILRRAGVALTTATPLVLCALTLASWLLLTWAAWRRGHRALAIATPAAGLALGAHYWLFSAFYAPAFGRFLAVLGAAAALASQRRTRATEVSIAVALFGVVVDPSALLLVAPLLVLVRPTLRILVRAAVPAVAWLGFVTWYDHRHPELRFWGTGAGGVSADALGRSAQHPGRFFALFAPELLRSWIVAAAITAVVLAGCVLTRRAVPIVAASSGALVFVAIVASRRAPLDLHSRFFPGGRLLLALPFALWLLVLVAVEHRDDVRLRAPRGRALCAVVVVAGLVAFGVRTVAHDARVDADVNGAHFESYNLVPAQYVRQDCARADSLLGRDGIAVYYFQFWMAYACNALRNMPTLAPLEERRPWVLQAEARTHRTRFVLWGGGGEICGAFRSIERDCFVDARPGMPNIAVVDFDQGNVVAFLHAANLPIRAMTGIRQGIPG